MVIPTVLEKWAELAELEEDAERARYDAFAKNIPAAEAARRGFALVRLIVKSIVSSETRKWLMLFCFPESLTHSKAIHTSSVLNVKEGDLIEVRLHTSKVKPELDSLCKFPLLLEAVTHEIVLDANGKFEFCSVKVENSRLKDFYAKIQSSQEESLSISSHRFVVSVGHSSAAYLRRKEIIDHLKSAPVDPDQQMRLFKFLTDPYSFHSFIHRDRSIRLRGSDHLNHSQRHAVQFCLQTSPVACIHGPPGTGKTATMAVLVNELVKMGNRVLIAAASNVAVDNFLEKLMSSYAHLKCLRLGHPSRVAPRVAGSSLDLQLHVSRSKPEDSGRDRELQLTKMIPMNKEDEDWVNELKSLSGSQAASRSKHLHEVVDEASVVFATCIGCLSMEFREYLHWGHTPWRDKLFDVVIIDEAGQALEIDTWIPICLGKKVILAGDPRQLGPTILDAQARDTNMGGSLLERLLTTASHTSVMLNVQYRMNTKIMQWSSTQFYDGRLSAHSSVANSVIDPAIQPFVWLDTSTVASAGEDCVEIDSAKSRDWRGITRPAPTEQSRSNSAEAKLVVNYIKTYLLPHAAKIDSLAIISPYSRQVKLIRQVFEQAIAKSSLNSPEVELYQRTKIATVDGFQGREMTAVIISLVRSNATRRIGFMADPKRLNVALTRARRHCAIIGAANNFSGHPLLRTISAYAASLGQLKDAAVVFSEDVLKRLDQCTTETFSTAKYGDTKAEEASTIADETTRVATSASEIPSSVAGSVKNMNEVHFMMANTLHSGAPVAFSSIRLEDVHAYESLAASLGLVCQAHPIMDSWTIYISRQDTSFTTATTRKRDKRTKRRQQHSESNESSSEESSSRSESRTESTSETGSSLTDDKRTDRHPSYKSSPSSHKLRHAQIKIRKQRARREASAADRRKLSRSSQDSVSPRRSSHRRSRRSKDGQKYDKKYDHYNDARDRRHIRQRSQGTRLRRDDRGDLKQRRRYRDKSRSSGHRVRRHTGDSEDRYSNGEDSNGPTRVPHRRQERSDDRDDSLRPDRRSTKESDRQKKSSPEVPSRRRKETLSGKPNERHQQASSAVKEVKEAKRPQQSRLLEKKAGEKAKSDAAVSQAKETDLSTGESNEKKSMADLKEVTARKQLPAADNEKEGLTPIREGGVRRIFYRRLK